MSAAFIAGDLNSSEVARKELAAHEVAAKSRAQRIADLEAALSEARTNEENWQDAEGGK